MRRAFLTVLLLAACDSAGAPAPAPSPAPPAALAPSSTAAALQPPDPKATKDTAAGELGTLPEGVGIAVGHKAPPFELRDKDGRTVRLAELLEKSEVLLVFYRGGW